MKKITAYLLVALFSFSSLMAAEKRADLCAQFKGDFEGKCSIAWNGKTGGAKRIMGSHVYLDSR